mgnify:CR=1 FL=1
MTEEKLKYPTKTTAAPRYIIMSFAAVACIATGVFGYISDMPEFAELAGKYQSILYSNWAAFVFAGLIIGAINLVLTLKRIKRV